MEDGTDAAHAVDPAGFQVTVIHRHEGLAQHEDKVGRYQVGHDQPGEGVQPVQAGYHHIDGHKGDLDRHHQRAQHHQEQGVLVLEAALAEAVGGEDAHPHLAQHDEEGGYDGVEEIQAEGSAAQHIRIVLPLEGDRPQRGHIQQQLLACFEGGDDHPVDREQHDQSDHDGCRVLQHHAKAPEEPLRLEASAESR